MPDGTVEAIAPVMDSRGVLGSGPGVDWPKQSPFSDDKWFRCKVAYEDGYPLRQCMEILGAKGHRSVSAAAERYGWERKTRTDPQTGEAVETIYQLPPDLHRFHDVESALIAVRSGATMRVAAASGRFSQEELEAILERDADVRREFDKAQADLAIEMANNLRRRAPTDTKASQWFLERSPMTKEDYKSPDGPAAGAGGGGIQVVLNIERATVDGPKTVDVAPLQIEAANG